MARMNRQKPEVDDGIGSWLKALEILGHVNVVTNSILIFFTHKTYKHMFVADDEHDISDSEVINELGIENIGLDLAIFVMSIVLIEHMIIGVKLLISFMYSEEPEVVVEGLKDRANILSQYKEQYKMKKKDKK